MESLKQILVPGEIVVSTTHFSLWTIAWSLARAGFFFAVGAALCLLDKSWFFGYASIGGYIALGAGALFLAGCTLRYRNSRLWITDHRLIVQTGWPGRDILDFPYNRFESAKVNQSLAGRLFDYGDIEIAGVGSTIAHLRCVGSPLAFKRSLEKAQSSKRDPPEPR